MAKNETKNKKSFLKDFKAELKKVIWPTPKQLFNKTLAVVVICIIIAAIVFVLDVAFESMNKHGVDRVKEIITTTNSVVDQDTTETNTDTENNN